MIVHYILNLRLEDYQRTTAMLLPKKKCYFWLNKRWKAPCFWLFRAKIAICAVWVHVPYWYLQGEIAGTMRWLLLRLKYTRKFEYLETSPYLRIEVYAWVLYFIVLLFIVVFRQLKFLNIDSILYFCLNSGNLKNKSKYATGSFFCLGEGDCTWIRYVEWSKCNYWCLLGKNWKTGENAKLVGNV